MLYVKNNATLNFGLKWPWHLSFDINMTFASKPSNGLRKEGRELGIAEPWFDGAHYMMAKNRITIWENILLILLHQNKNKVINITLISWSLCTNILPEWITIFKKWYSAVDELRVQTKNSMHSCTDFNINIFDGRWVKISPILSF